MLAYESEANRRVLAALRSVPEAKRGQGSAGGAEFRRACGILAHGQMARRMWLSRLGAIARPEWVMFPDWPLERLEAEMSELDRLWGNYLETLRAGDLEPGARVVHYQSNDGAAWESSIDEILTHVHNHSTYHRGQVALLIAACAGERPVTDFIVMTRRPA